MEMETVTQTSNLTPGAEKPKEETPAKEFNFDIEEYILNGYATREVKRKAFSFKIKTLKNDECMLVYDKTAAMTLDTKGQADAALEAWYVALCVVELNGTKLQTRPKGNNREDFEKYANARYAMVQEWGGQLTDAIYAEFNLLCKDVRLALEEPAEIIKNS